MINEANYFQTIDTKTKGNQNLKLVGCNHGTPQSPGDFYERRAFYEEVGEWADSFILEQSAYREFHESPFFHNISQLAYHQNKRIYAVDPINERSMNLQKRLEKKYELSEDIYKMRLKEGYKSRVSREKYKTKHPEGTEIHYHNHVKEDWWKFSYGVDDWRNVVIATLLTEKISQLKDKNILAIHGGGHTRPINFYLKNPKIREQKLQQYNRFNEAGTSCIKEFIPRPDLCDKNESCWERNLIPLEANFTWIRWN